MVRSAGMPFAAVVGTSTKVLGAPERDESTTTFISVATSSNVERTGSLLMYKGYGCDCSHGNGYDCDQRESESP